MKVFISWSGQRSKTLADTLKLWLPMVLQYVEPWVSESDINAGDRWALKIGNELESSNFGIICITPENVNADWILFEAGALSKSMQDAKVIPLLYDLELSDLSGPLSQFQAKKVEESGIKEIVQAINKHADKPASDKIVDNLVPSLWPQLSDSLKKMPAIEAIESHKRPQREVLEELVTSVRGLNSHVRQFDPRMERHERHFKHPALQFHPAMFDELFFLLSKAGNSSAAILAVSGYIRDDFPWLSEILNEFYRELRNSNNKNIAPNIKRLQTFLEILSEDAEVIGISRNSKYAMRMFGELPRVFDMILHHVLVDTRQNDQSLETVVDTDTNG